MNTQEQLAEQSRAVLTNAGTLVAGVIKEIAGNEISTSLGGSSITTTIISSLAFQRITASLTEPAQK